MTDGIHSDHPPAPIPLFGRHDAQDEVNAQDGLDSLNDEVERAREMMTTALLDAIDASMPAEADFVNYEVNDSDTGLVIREACGQYGEELDLQQFAPISVMLAQLGVPEFDFDGELVANELDDYGWERTQPFSADRIEGAMAAAARAMNDWTAAVKSLQDHALNEIWKRLPMRFDGLEFEWDADARCLCLVAAIGQEGRVDRTSEDRLPADRPAAYITEPELSGIRRNELSGLYRSQR